MFSSVLSSSFHSFIDDTAKIAIAVNSYFLQRFVGLRLSECRRLGCNVGIKAGDEKYYEIINSITHDFMEVYVFVEIIVSYECVSF